MRVVYLFGAGASHACVNRVGSPHGILMRDLTLPLRVRLRKLVNGGFSDIQSLIDLVNSVDEDTDFEHLITFLDDVPSIRHRRFAEEIRKAFESVLREKLEVIRKEAEKDPIELYEVTLDMHNVDQFPEILHGIITLNYDEYIETAIENVFERPADFGIRVEPSSQEINRPKLLKLHGSFGWKDTWPISRGYARDGTLWIPPGIKKAKQAYPFNVLWGLAREMLACDVLRVVGCRLGPNDWDLISLLFTMRHDSLEHRPQIEIIDAPNHVNKLKEDFPYLDVRSILDLELIGSTIISDLTGKPLQRFEDFKEDEQQEILWTVGNNRNWFDLWLNGKVAHHAIELGDLSTPKGFVKTFSDA